MKAYLLYHGNKYLNQALPDVITYKQNAIAQAGRILQNKIKAKGGRGDLAWNQWREIKPQGNIIKGWETQIEEIIIYEVETK
jgi:hypothetical protein